MDDTNLFHGALVRLAALRAEDIPIMARWTEDSAYMRLLESEPVRPLSADEIANRNSGGGATANRVLFRVRTLEDDRLIGFISLYNIQWSSGSCMLGIGIGEREYRGRGYGSDALRLGLRYAFDEMNMYRVGLEVSGYNARAIRAYEKAGFQREGVIRGGELRDGRRTDVIHMGILRDEWRAL